MATPQPVPYSIVVPTEYGQMILNRNDINQTNALFKTGRAIDHHELVLVGDVLALRPADPVILDVGANFGTYTLYLAGRLGPSSKVHAFEGQRVIANMVAGSAALNALENVWVHNVAIGDHEGSVEIPQFSYSRPLNFGSVEFGVEQRERLEQPRGKDPAGERVRLTTIDAFRFGRVDLIKFDVEGMELEALAGAVETIRRCRPILYVEYIKVNRQQLGERLLALGYALYANNINFLAIPLELSSRLKLGPGAPVVPVTVVNPTQAGEPPALPATPALSSGAEVELKADEASEVKSEEAVLADEA